jgi:hypothetical protein
MNIAATTMNPETRLGFDEPVVNQMLKILLGLGRFLLERDVRRLRHVF